MLYILEHCKWLVNCAEWDLARAISPDTLAALRELPKINPHLYHELLGEGKASPLTDEEEPFADEVEDDSDIPIATVASHVASGRSDVVGGFEVLRDGGIVALAEGGKHARG